ncbi:MAG: FdhD protein [Candidatus Poriferisodalaceae bacterium]|jgi:FdhD protein
MRRGRTEKVLVRRLRDGEFKREPDEVIVEEPLEIRLDGNLVATTMRTPGHDYELAAGFCMGDGLLGGARVLSVRYCGEGPAAEFEYNVVSVETGGRAPVPTPRVGNVSSSCGLCGSSTLTDMETRLSPVKSDVVFTADVLVGVSDAVHKQQDLFTRTGGLHAAAVFDPAGNIEVVREDIGRHNAVDKINGRRLLDGRDDSGSLGMFVSGRASFEMVQKAWAAGFGTLIAVSAPSALAVDAARAANMTLVGFARGKSLNVYSGEVLAGP